MTRDQVRTTFDEIVEPQINRLASEKLADLMDLSASAGPCPEAQTPKLVSKLWK